MRSAGISPDSRTAIVPSRNIWYVISMIGPSAAGSTPSARIDRSTPSRLASDAMNFRGSRCVWITSASGYSAKSCGSVDTCAG